MLNNLRDSLKPVLQKIGKSFAATGLSPNIFTGIGDTKLRNLYRRSLCLFLPFKDVTACNSILESLACGTPIITNKIGDNIDYLDEKCAIFAKDKNSFIDSIKYIIKNKDSEDYKDMRQEARNKALNFDWNLISQKIC